MFPHSAFTQKKITIATDFQQV